MTEEEIKKIVTTTLEYQSQTFPNIIRSAVEQTLSNFGIEKDDRKEFRADLIHLRRWRKSVEHAQGYTLTAVITVIVSGVLGALWLGVRMLLSLKS